MEEKISIHFPGSPTGALPSPWQAFSSQNQTISSELALSSVKRMPPQRAGGMKPAQCYAGLPFLCPSSHEHIPGQVSPCIVSPVSWNESLGCSHQPWLRAWADEATGSCSLQLPLASSTWRFPLLQQDGAGTVSTWKQSTELKFGPEEAWGCGKTVGSGKTQFWAHFSSTNLCEQRFVLSQFASCRMEIGAPWRRFAFLYYLIPGIRIQLLPFRVE